MTMPTQADPPHPAARRRNRHKNLVVLLSCLALGAFAVVLVQNPALRLGREPEFVGQVAFSPDGKRLGWTSEGRGEGRVVVWDLHSGRRCLLIGPRDSEPELTVRSTYSTLAFSPDGLIIATGTRSAPGPDPRVILWDSTTGQRKRIFRGHTDAVIALAFAPDGKTLATASRDRTVRLWDPDTGQERSGLQAGNASVTSLAFSPDGRSLASGWTDHLVRIWNVEAGTLSASLQGHRKGVSCVTYSPRGMLASGGFVATLRLWDPSSGQARSTHEGLPNTPRAMSFSGDGMTLAIKFAETSTGTLWDVEAGMPRATFENAAAGLAFAPEGSTLATAGGAQGRLFLVDALATTTAADPVSTSPR